MRSEPAFVYRRAYSVRLRVIRYQKRKWAVTLYFNIYRNEVWECEGRRMSEAVNASRTFGVTMPVVKGQVGR